MHEYAKAEPFNKEALRIRQKILGPEHLDTAESLNHLAALYQDMHEYVKAEPLYLEALRIRQKVLGPEFPDTANRLDRLAGLYRDMSKYAKAEPLYREALRIRQKILGPEHPDTVQSFRYKGVVLDSIVEDRLLAEASQGSEDPQLVEQLNLDKRQLGQLLLQPAQKLTAETNQRIETIEGEVEKIGRASPNRSFSKTRCIAAGWHWLEPKPRLRPGSETRCRRLKTTGF